MSSLNHQFIRPRFDVIPIMSEEIENLQNDYQQLASQEQDNKQNKHLIEKMHEIIYNRIQDLEQFVDENFMDPRTTYIEKMKYQLQKIIKKNLEEKVPQPQPQKTSVEQLIIQNSKIQQGNKKTTLNYQEKLSASKHDQVLNKNQLKSNQVLPHQKYETQIKSDIKELNQIKNLISRHTSKFEDNRITESVYKFSPQKFSKFEKSFKSQTQNQEHDVVFQIKMNKQEYLDYLESKKKLIQ